MNREEHWTYYFYFCFFSDDIEKAQQYAHIPLRYSSFGDIAKDSSHVVESHDLTNEVVNVGN